MFNWLKNLLYKEQTSKKERIFSFLIALAYVVAMGIKGASNLYSSFYASLTKPNIQPPDWVFTVIWPILFVLMATALYYVWNFYESDIKRKYFVFLYIINGYLIYLGSHLFFGNNNITSALYAIIALVIVIEGMILLGFGSNKKGAYLLIPYLIWVLFTLYLNTSILILNT